MKENDLKQIAEDLLETFEVAGKESMRLFSEGLQIKIKEDNYKEKYGMVR